MVSKPYRIALLPAAKRDIFEIAAYIALDSKERAIKYIDKIHLKIKNLSVHPLIGHLPKDTYLKRKGYRVLVIGKYLVFYVVQKHTVRIRRILHGSRDILSIL